MTDRLTELAERYGVADGLLHDEARKEFYTRTARSGARSYGKRHGRDIVTAGEIVSMVYVRWAEKAEVSVEWFDALVGEGAEAKMLRRYCVNAADDLLQQNIEYRRDAGVEVAFYAEQTDEAGGDDWLMDSAKYAVRSAEDEALKDTRGDRMEDRWHEIAESIIAGVSSDTMRKVLKAYVLDGLQHRDIAAALGIGIETSKRAYVRAVKNEEDIACLVVYRNLRHKGQEGTGRAPAIPKALPVRFIEAAQELGIEFTG